MADAMYSLVSYPALHEYLKLRGLEEVNGIVWSKVANRLRAIYDRLV